MFAGAASFLRADGQKKMESTAVSTISFDLLVSLPSWCKQSAESNKEPHSLRPLGNTDLDAF